MQSSDADLPTWCFPDLAEGRARLIAWLAQGAGEAVWAIGSVPPERLVAAPPEKLASLLGTWPAARHLRHVALFDAVQTLPLVRVLVEETIADAPGLAFEQQDAAWDPGDVDLPGLLATLGETRYELLQLAESAPDEAWHRALPPSLTPPGRAGAAPVGLAWLLARSYQHELEHLNALWKLTLHWDRAAAATGAPSGLRFHPADRMESH